MTAIKLGVAGTHSTGKSTLLQALAELLSGRGLRIGRVGDIAGAAHDRGFPILRDHTFESTLWIMTSVIAAELEVGLRADVILVDRPALDALGYLWAALKTREATLEAGQEGFLLDLARLHSPTYDVLCKTTLDETVPLGEGRDPDLVFRAEADAQIGAAFAELGIEPRAVVRGDAFVEQLADEVFRLHQGDF